MSLAKIYLTEDIPGLSATLMTYRCIVFTESNLFQGDSLKKLKGPNVKHIL